MDQVSLKNISLKNCVVHPKNKVIFIQVNELSTHPNSNIFQCQDCVEQNLQFKAANYMFIQKIIDNSESDFHYKWPPLNDQHIIQSIQLKANTLNSNQNIFDQVSSFFAELKDEIIQKIDICQKNAINQSQKIQFSQEQVLKRYQEISQIHQLRSLLIQSQNNSYDIYQQQCKEFIQKVESLKDKNTQLFQELLNQCEQVKELISLDKLNESKQFILNYFDSLDIFEDKMKHQLNINKIVTNKPLQQQDKSKIDKLMQLISNKTNYCSEEFLNQIRQQLQKLSSSFEQISFDKMNQKNKKAIRFSDLNDKQINNVNEYVEHLINMQNNLQYAQQIKNSNQIQKLQNVFDNKFNFISKNYQNNFIEYLIETFPFFKKINTDQIYSQEQSFSTLRSLEINYINNFIKLIKKKQNLDENQQNFANSQTQKVQQEIIQKFNFEKYELENILKMFPIFDLIELKKINILNELQFQKSGLNDGNQRLEIIKNMNNQLEISINETNYQGPCKSQLTNCISQILERDKKYIFRIQFKKGVRGLFMIGLMQNRNFNNSVGYNENMSYYFKLENNKMNYKGGHGIGKFVKGDKQQFLGENSTLELRVWLQGQQLEVLDYPNYKYQVQIKDEYKQNLLQNDLCLYFYQSYHQDKYILTEALTVKQY